MKKPRIVKDHFRINLNNILKVKSPLLSCHIPGFPACNNKGFTANIVSSYKSKFRSRFTLFMFRFFPSIRINSRVDGFFYLPCVVGFHKFDNRLISPGCSRYVA